MTTLTNSPYREPVPYPEVTLRPLGFRLRMLLPFFPAIVLTTMALIAAIPMTLLIPETVSSTFACHRDADVVTCVWTVDGRATSYSAKRDDIHVTQHRARNNHYECMSFGSRDVYCEGPASVAMTPVMALEPGEQFLWDKSRPLRGPLLSVLAFVCTVAFVAGAVAFLLGRVGRGPTVRLRVTPLALEGAPSGPLPRRAGELVTIGRVGPARTFAPRFAIYYGEAGDVTSLGEWCAYGGVELEPMANALRAALAQVPRREG